LHERLPLIFVNAPARHFPQTHFMFSALRSLEGLVFALVAEKFHARATSLTAHTHLKRDLGADSLALVELVMLLESEFKVDIPDEDVERIATVQHVIDYLREEVVCDGGMSLPACR
jgi:acyl carrier protein